MSTRGKVWLVVGLALAALAFDAAFAARHGFFDLNVYYGAINYWINEGGEVYDFVRRNSTYGFTYPAFGALTMLPMAFLSWPAAVVIGSLMTILVTVWFMRILLDPMIREHGWTPWFVVAISLCLLAVYEPMRETFLFGQVNMLLVGLVAADLLLLVRRGSRWGGIGIGLATAIKLTPGIFIVYLLITKRVRETIIASVTALAATLFAAVVAPDASREFWTSALWDTDRVGALSYISNQSLQGLIARLDPSNPSKLLWVTSVLVVLLFWGVRGRAAIKHGDEVLGLALTGIVGVLISPVTWVHHLVWAIPAFVLLVERGGKGRLVFAAVAFIVLSSRVVWLYEEDFGGLSGFLFSNAYVWIMLALLVVTPGRHEVIDARSRSAPRGSRFRFLWAGTER
ncbi:MAG TPA: glycosyltransferase 87 family protein [Candidatus Limnocylindrales bacterium]|nr:glycosyltransferase 87 family protein [Candidatus Limnocylindrales bacterium]